MLQAKIRVYRNQCRIGDYYETAMPLHQAGLGTEVPLGFAPSGREIVGNINHVRENTKPGTLFADMPTVTVVLTEGTDFELLHGLVDWTFVPSLT